MRLIPFGLAAVAALIWASVASAQVGVGVTLAEMRVDEPLAQGGIYRLGTLGVINTGKVPSDYGLGVLYEEGQPQLRPEEAWFGFSPGRFRLEPDAVQNVAVTLNLPVNVRPGDYFVYLEAHPVMPLETGGVGIGVAAATRLLFTVRPANLLAAVYYRVTSFLEITSPASYWILGLILAAGVVLAFRRFFAVTFRLQRK